MNTKSKILSSKKLLVCMAVVCQSALVGVTVNASEKNDNVYVIATALDADSQIVIQDKRNSIYTGNIGNENVIMSILRDGNKLTAAYVKQHNEENEIKLEGILDSENGSFELHNENSSFSGNMVPGTDKGDLLEGTYTVAENNEQRQFSLGLSHCIDPSEQTRYSIVSDVTAQEAEDFAHKIKEYFSQDKKYELSQMISYPLVVNSNGSSVLIETPEKFIESYDEIADEEFKLGVYNAYSKYMSYNYMGIMLGNGEVWFSGFSGQEGLKIWAINT